MKIIYNGFDFSELGELFVTQTREMEGAPDQPQRARVTLRVRVEVFERSYDANREALERCRPALQLPNAVLQWSNDVAGVDYVNQTAALVSDDLPEEWGEYHQVLNLVFTYYEQTPGGAENNLPLTFTQNGTTLQFDVVNRWRQSAAVERFSTLRKQRKETHVTVRVEGQWLGDTTQPLDSRRTALAAQAAQFNATLNGAEGTLTYGESGEFFQKVVRIEQWECEVDQAVNAINFSFTCGYTLLPDETDYTTTEFNVDEQDDYTGVVNLAVSGKIQAATLAAAQAKLTALLAALTAQRGYNQSQPVRLETADANVDCLDGATFTELSFNAAYRRWKDTNQKATYQRTGSPNPPVSFGEVRTWRDHYAAQRVSEMRSERRHATGSVDAAGTWTVDKSMALKDRRAALLARQRAMKAEVNSADGVLTYGDWTQTVRVEDFQAEINQAETGIDWSLSASYTLFPNEGGYATAQFAVDFKADAESGDEIMGFSGRIEAPNGVLARAKLDALRTAVLKIYGWTVTQRLRANTTLNAIDANGDRTAGIPEGLESAGDYSALSLNFSEDYRRRSAGTLVSSAWTRTDREDVPGQLLVTTFAGTVTASGATADAAYATALARAQAIGANRETAIDASTVFKGSTLAMEERQTTAANAVEFVRLTFNYEYQSKLAAGRAFLEVTTSLAQDTFGTDTETCAGVVMARDLATAQALYEAQVKTIYAGRIIRSEQTGAMMQQTQVTSGEFAGQHIRYEFNLSVYSPKAKGKTAWKYSFEVTRDLLTLDLRTAVSGSVYAVDRYTADAALDTLFAYLKLGASVRSRRAEDHERVNDTDVFLKLDFEDEFLGRVTGISGLGEMTLTERVQYSGTRWSVQNLPYDDGVIGAGGISIPQPTGHEPGARTVTGTVTAASLATAQAWAWKQQALLTGDKRGKRFSQPPQMEIGYDFVPRIDGIPQGNQANVKLHRVSFTFTEILPYYPAS
jgi:hypothetical protein